MGKALFEFHVRVNARSRYVRLRVSAERGLEVIVPRGYDVACVPGLIAQRQDWIRRALERAQALRGCLEPEPAWQLPGEITLPAVEQTWRITARESGARGSAVREIGPRLLLVHGRVADADDCAAALGRWLVRQGVQYLVPWLERLGGELGLRHGRTYVRRQRTRWGSCSSRKAIALNAKLLFLPPAQVRSVMVHELCHLVEMNHSPRFWRLVERHDPDFRAHNKVLREAWRMIPRWAN